MAQIPGDDAYPPIGYVTPPFPSLTFQFPDITSTTSHRLSLYYIRDIWRFTVLWTIIIFGVVHAASAAAAIIMQGGKKRSWMYLWLAPLVYFSVSMVQGIFVGSVVGLILAAVYNAGYCYMSTWVPMLWGLISVLVLIISSFTIQGGL